MIKEENKLEILIRNLKLKIKQNLY